MTDAATLAFSPLLSPSLVIVLGVLALAAAVLALLRGLKGWLWRALAALALVGVLSNPALVREQREALNDIALLILDDSASMQIGARQDVAEAAADALRSAAGADPSLDLIEISGGAAPDGTRITPILQEGLGRIPRDRLAGVVVISDGQIHDVPENTDSLVPPAPFHHLVAGRADAGDRRLIISEAPRYGLVGDEAVFTLRVEDEGEPAGTATVALSVDGGEPINARVSIGQDVQVRALIQNRGANTVQIEVEPGREELSLINNEAAVTVTGVRDRLRVLLVTGEPHNGARAWRNLLKSDPSVDLVHFTILRPPDRDDSIPPNELALIAFPTFELFQLRLEEFDMVIFDRYRRRGILSALYLDNVANYVEGGGALLVTTGPPFAGGASLARSPLAAVLPAAPDGTIIEGAFTPMVSQAGARHPVTAPLLDQQSDWGPWFRQIGAREVSGETVLESEDGEPLLTLAHAGEGRAAILLSDQAWLWARGYDGGGPHDELFRRVAHWLMGEPELDEERLTARVSDGRLSATRTTLAEDAPPLQIEWPSGRIETLSMGEIAPGRFAAETDALEQGLVRLTSGELTAVTASGALNPREYADLTPDPERLRGLADATRGGVRALESVEDAPQIRRVRADTDATGRNWIGLQRNNAYVVVDAERTPLAPGLLLAAILLALLAGAWHRESA